MKKLTILRRSIIIISSLMLMTTLVFADHALDRPSECKPPILPTSKKDKDFSHDLVNTDESISAKPISGIALEGKISHTENWEKNRNQFNAYCRNSGNVQWERSTVVYWSGEKFSLSATVAGQEQPSTVTVKIQGHPYETTLHKNGASWEGELFDKSMLDRWGRDGPEILQFVFSAVIDGSRCEDIQRVTVDDLHKYWLMHRKE